MLLITKLSPLFPGKSVLKGNFLILTLSWVITYFAIPIPQTYASLYHLSLGADEFLLSIIGFAGSVALARAQLSSADGIYDSPKPAGLS